ncbi:MAG: dihydroorotase [Burkholderiaceae bacterium]
MATPDFIELTRPDDWHLHLRDGAVLKDVVLASARQFARAIVMPNLKPPVKNLADAVAYRNRIIAALEEAEQATPDSIPNFEPLMTLYLTDRTTPADIEEAAASGVVQAVKLYPAGATTNSDDGVTSIDRLLPTLAALQQHNLPLLIHGEVTDNQVDVFDREARFIDDVLEPLRANMPELRIVFEHITTEQAASYVRETSGPIAATITPQHLLYNRNAIFSGGLRPHWYCLPILKRENHRLALVKAATSGNPRFFLGTDSAPHPAHLKEHAAGCAGCFSAPYAIELYATAFELAGRLDRLEGFASQFGADFYGLPRNTDRIVLRRVDHQIADSLPFGEHQIVPLAAGEQLQWRLESTQSAHKQ